MTALVEAPGATRIEGPPRGVVVGTGGHVDHGKTALVQALTGVDTDRWAEEKERGLTIDIGFARLSLDPGIEAGIVDVPGHEDFLRNMLAGATGIDLLLLVVAADEGPMPQTFEHLSIARLLGVRRGIAAVSKADRVDPDWLELVKVTVAEEIRAAMDGVEWPVVAVSSITGEGMEALREAIRREAGRVAERPRADLFRMPVDRSFTVHGTGTVATGTVWSGEVAVGDTVRILPGGSSPRVRSLQVHGEARDRVAPGRRCALALVGVDPWEVPRGSTIVREEVWQPVLRLGARVRAVGQGGRPLEHGQRVRVYHGTREVMARLLLAGTERVPPAGEAWGLLKLEDALVARVRDRFVLRFYSPVSTIGGGIVAEVGPPRKWRDRTRAWERLLAPEPRDVLRAFLELRGGRGALEEEILLACGLPTGTVAALADRPPPGLTILEGRWFLEGGLEEARLFLLEELGALHREHPRSSTASKEALRAAAARRFAEQLVERALATLAEEGAVVLEGPGIRLPEHRPALRPEERRLQETLLTRIQRGGLEPPAVGELHHELSLDRDLLNDLLVLLKEEERIVALSPEIYLSAEAARDLVARARTVLARHPVAPLTLFKEEFGVTRKYLIPALEYLDRTGVTRRTGEGREAAG